MKQTVLRLRCLVVLPVHDLAVQVYRVYSSFCRGTKLHVALISGDSSFFEEQQLLVKQYYPKKKKKEEKKKVLRLS